MQQPMETSSTPVTMSAIQQVRYGNSQVLTLEQIPVPAPRAHEVLVEVAAAGVDRAVWHLMTGKPYIARLALGLRRPRQRTPGRELSGRVVACGAKVTSFAVGDEVFGFGIGTYARFARARVKKVTRRVAALDPVIAASLPISGTTALQVVRDIAKIRPGQRVLVIGASGGVGILAVQLARHYGAEVSGVCSAAKSDLVLANGAAETIDYASDWIAEHAGRFDAVIDIAGNRTIRDVRRLLVRSGTLVIVGGEDGGDLMGGIQRQIVGSMLGRFRRPRISMIVATEGADDIADLGRLVIDGRLDVPIDRTYPLAQVADALGNLEAGHVRGKVAITVGPT